MLPGMRILALIACSLPIDRCQERPANDLSIVGDYFLRKAAPTVVGFACDPSPADYVGLTKRLSRASLTAAVLRLEDLARLPSTLKSIHHRLGVFIDLRCRYSERIKLFFDEAANHRMFGESHHWLALGSNLSESLALVSEDSFGLSTDFAVAVCERGECRLYDVYNPCKSLGGELTVTQFGTWKESRGLRIGLWINKALRWNLRGMKLKLGALIRDRSTNASTADYLQDYNLKERDLLTRLGYGLWTHVADMFNFTLDLQEYNIENESLDGDPVIKALIKGDIDISGTVYRVTSERINLVANVYEAFTFRTFFIFRSSSSDNPSVRNIFLPLSPTVWYLMLGLTLLSIHVLAFLTLFAEEEEASFESYLRSVLAHASAFCQQGIEFSPSNASGRIAVLHILLFNLLFYNYYLASAVSNRLGEPGVLVEDSLRELASRSYGLASEPILDRDDYAKEWSLIPESRSLLPPEEGMALVSEGGFAYHSRPEVSYPYVARHFDERKVCELREVHLVRPHRLSILAAANGSFLQMFRTGFIKLSEAGVRHRLIERWTAKRPTCRSELLTAVSVTITEVTPAIVFLLVGIVLSSAVLAAERLLDSASLGRATTRPPA